MIKRFGFLFILLVVSIQLSAQESRGVSQPGRITSGVKEVVSQQPLQSSHIVPTITYSDPSGDNILSEGEKGYVIIEVDNRSENQVISPKLDIQITPSWTSQPQTSIKWLEDIQPGQTGTYRTFIEWDEKFPSGNTTYEVKVVDTQSGIESDPVRVTFDVKGIGDKPLVSQRELAFVDVDINIPRMYTSNYNAIAIIIGNKVYQNPDVPDVEYAINDANTVKKYLLSLLGYREENIIFIENAKKADFEHVFGTKEIYQAKLYNWVKPNQSDVFIYYSGHGAPDLVNKKAYFMPTNSDPNYIRIGGYPLDVFYQNLTKIPAKSITIVLDACFSGGSQRGMLIQNASPMYIDVENPLLGSKYTLLSSSAGDQISSWYPKGNHSLFTYYFLRAIRGEADQNKNKRITLEEVNAYIQDNVPYMARRLYGREQTPIIKGNSNSVICFY